METPEVLSLVGAAAFFLVGLLTGAWKWAAIRCSDQARAPVYVDTAHRASLLYAFACLLLARMVAVGALSAAVEVGAVATLILFFALSVLGYVVHGLLRDTENQLARPHRLGPRTIPTVAMDGFMASLIAAEIGAFCVLLFGLIRAL